MAAPSPIHRDPEKDGSDYGCLGRRRAKANNEVARLVERAQAYLRFNDFADGGELVEYVRDELREIDRTYDCGCCDMVVKENVFAALADAIEDAKLIDFDRMQIYGWGRD